MDASCPRWISRIGDALVLFRDVPPLGYLALSESDRDARPPAADGEALDAKAGGFTVLIDQATGAIRSLTGPDGKERVKPSDWSGVNQLVYARGGEHSALWTSGNRDDLKNPPQLELTQAKLASCHREKLPALGAARRRADAPGFPASRRSSRCMTSCPGSTSRTASSRRRRSRKKRSTSRSRLRS